MSLLRFIFVIKDMNFMIFIFYINIIQTHSNVSVSIRYYKKQRNRNTPSRQRRRARRAAARGKHEDHHAEEAQDDLLASEAHANYQTNQNEAAEATGNSVKAVEVIPVTPFDEFCRDAEFEENILSDENSVTLLRRTLRSL